jgi:hypothetical protein
MSAAPATAAATPAATPAPSKPAVTTPAAAPAAPVVKTTAAKTAPTPMNNASTSDIASAQAKGMVWVNTETKVYHKGGRWYGKTKQGKFMSESDAQAAGYKAAKAEIGEKK